MSRRNLTASEIRFLQEDLGVDYKTSNIRLREGEYQYDLAKTIASFHLELYLPDVKDIIKRLYGEEKTNDIKFIRKIQTILKKGEKQCRQDFAEEKALGITKIHAFKFQDVDKNVVFLRPTSK